MIYKMKANPRVQYRYNEGWEYTDDGGVTWYFTQRTTEEVERMCNVTVATESNLIDAELELFGDTLDEPLPDDLIAMLLS